tara:strand:- start:2027 stop:2206 length:180 start_codon:yes stop_codon:yes gene_type:complete
MIVSKILKNQILKIVKEVIGLNDNKWELRKIENDLRTQSGKISRLEANKCKCKCKGKDA